LKRGIYKKRFKIAREIEKDERIVVGVNRFQIEEKPPKGLLKVDPTVRVSQIEKLQKLREERDNDTVKSSLAKLKKGAKGDDNLMPLILEAVKAYATLGEICDTLREVFGEYQPVGTIG